MCSLSQIAENRGVIFRSPKSDYDRNSLKRRSFGASLKRRGSFKLQKSTSSNVENDDLVIERSNSVVSEEPPFWDARSRSISLDVRNVRVDSKIFHVSCQDDETPVNSDNESNELDDEKRRKSILDQMSLPQVLKDQGMTSLSSKVSFLLQ